MSRTIDDKTDDIIETQERLFEDKSNLTVNIDDIQKPVKFKNCGDYDELYADYSKSRMVRKGRFSFIPSDDFEDDEEVVVLTVSKDVYYEKRIVIPYKALVDAMDFLEYDYITEFVKKELRIENDIIHLYMDRQDYVTDNITYHEFNYYTMITSLLVLILMVISVVIIPYPISTIITITLLLFNFFILFALPKIVKNYYTFKKN